VEDEHPGVGGFAYYCHYLSASNLLSAGKMGEMLKGEVKRRCAIILIAFYCVGLWSYPEVVRAQFGELPSDAVSRSSMGSADEIVLYLAFDPAIAQDLLPQGIRFRTLEEIARRPDSAAFAEYLRAHPEHKGWAYSFLEIIHPASLEYDGHTAELGKRGGMAVWYAYAARTDTADTRPRGSQLLALGTWLSDKKLVAQMRAKGYPAEYAEIEFRQDRSGVVRGRLKTGGLEIRGRCRLAGEPYAPDFGEPPFMQTIWTPRTSAQTFEIVTFYGHAQQKCGAPEWEISGTGLLAHAFRHRATGGTEISGTDYYAHYVLRGALYRRRPSSPNSGVHPTRDT
jgi:hypothetical protein